MQQIKEHNFYLHSPFNREKLEFCKKMNQTRM